MTYLIITQTSAQPLQFMAISANLIIWSFIMQMKRDMVSAGIVVVINFILDDPFFRVYNHHHYHMEPSKQIIESLSGPSSLSRMDYVRPSVPGFLTSSLFLAFLEAISNRSMEDCYKFGFMTYASIAQTTYMLPFSCTDSAFSASRDAVLLVHAFLCHH